MSDGTEFTEVPEVRETADTAEAKTELDRAAFDPEEATERSGDYQAAEKLESEFKAAMEGAASRTDSPNPSPGEGTTSQDAAGDAADQASREAFDVQQDREIAESEKEDAAPDIQAAQEHIQAMMEMVREMANQQQDAIGDTMFHMSAPAAADSGEATILIDTAALVQVAEISYQESAEELPEMDPDPVDTAIEPGTVAEVQSVEVSRDATSNQDPAEQVSNQTEFQQEYQPAEAITDQSPGSDSSQPLRGADSLGSSSPTNLRHVDLPEVTESDSQQISEEALGELSTLETAGAGSSAGTGEDLSVPGEEDLLNEFLKLDINGPADEVTDPGEGMEAELEILHNYKEVLGVLQADLGRLEGLLVMYQNLPEGGTGSGLGQGTFHLPSKGPDGSYTLVETTIPLSVPTIQLLIFQLSQHIDQIKDEISALE